jgi:hypothetical protein
MHNPIRNNNIRNNHLRTIDKNLLIQTLDVDRLTLLSN